MREKLENENRHIGQVVLKMKKSIAVALCLVLVGCGDSDEEKAAKDLAKAQERQAAINRMTPHNPCTVGIQVPSKELALNESYELRAAPNGEKIRNEKASEILGQTHYHSIDPSTTVKQICADGDWTMVQITSPDWLSSLKGWAPNSVFRNIERSGDGRRVYVESDVGWDETTLPFKRQIVNEINRISREPRCTDIDPYTVALSPTRSRPGKPVFFVTCGMNTTPFNVWFELPKE